MRTRIFFAIFFVSFFVLILLQAAIFSVFDNIYFINLDFKIEIFKTIFLVFLLITLLSLTLAYFISKSIVKPLYELDINELDKSFQYNELKTFLSQVKEHNKQFKKIRAEFSANVTHELKTPLTSIMLSSEMLKNNLVKKEDEKQFIDTIYNQSSALLEMIDEIIKLSFLDEVNNFEMTNVNISNVLSQIIKELDFKIREKNIKILMNIDEFIFFSNQKLIKTMLYNIIDNAIKYNIDNGKIIISLNINKKHIVLSIKDTGIGISKDIQNRIYERFFRQEISRNKQIKGTGLGLSIVKKIARIHKIKIMLNSELNKGSEFLLLFKNTKHKD
ncbi:hypothetical protein AVBRAN12640_08220 [Campylobacter sp. RM12640]|uniref:sensor histidine kinase n=2 Tax=Campylobacter TaxID=194 RepID=UPI00301463B8|nr:hypothetical protein [Campylobacter sp. RM12640]MBZ7989759.1 hypothetical protein [Campylobacter sp. RM12635]